MNPVEAIGVKPIEEPVPEARVGAASTGEPRIPLRLFALKDGDTFAVADASGNIVGDNDGLFRDDARVLSLYTMTLGGVAPSLLSAQMSQDNVLFVSNLTNRPLPPLGGRSLEHGVIHVERKRLLHGRRLYERICITNFARTGAIVPLEFSFAADFLDMFEVRGMARRARGKTAVPEIRDRSVQFSYLGLDGVERRSCISFSEQPISMSGRDASFVCVSYAPASTFGATALLTDTGISSFVARPGDIFRRRSSTRSGAGPLTRTSQSLPMPRIAAPGTIHSSVAR